MDDLFSWNLGLEGENNNYDNYEFDERAGCVAEQNQLKLGDGTSDSYSQLKEYPAASGVPRISTPLTLPFNPYAPIPYAMNKDLLVQHKKLARPNWGTEHPQFGLDELRTSYSKAELCFMNQWIQQQLLLKPKIRALVVSKCLAYIKQEPSAYPIFHLNHIVSNCHLRNGYRRLTIMAEHVRSIEGLHANDNNPLHGLTNNIINTYETYKTNNNN